MKKVLLAIAVMSFVAVTALLWKDYQLNNDETLANCSQPILIRAESPTWTTVVVDGFTVDIPYSSSWDVESTKCPWDRTYYDPAVYQVSEVHNNNESWFELAFGRPANNLTSIDHEYHLSQREATSMDMDVMPDGWSCLPYEIETPKEMSIGNTTGWRYFSGGAKWCEIVFRFTKGGQTYSLERNLEPRASEKMSDVELSEIDAEMQRIIESIHP